MRNKTAGLAAAATLLFTSAWLVLLIFDQARAGDLDIYAQALEHVRRLNAVYYAIYICAGLLTLSATILMAGLYELVRDDTPVAARMGAVFVPVYATLNLFVYFSQVTVVPALLFESASTPSPALDAVLRQMIHLAPGSVAGFANALAYAALAVPSILFGLLLWREVGAGVWMRSAGLLLAASGVLSVAGFLGLLVDVAPLAWTLVAGGAVFWLALFPLTFGLLRA